MARVVTGKSHEVPSFLGGGGGIESTRCMVLGGTGDMCRGCIGGGGGISIDAILSKMGSLMRCGDCGIADTEDGYVPPRFEGCWLTGLVGDIGRPSKERIGCKTGCPATLPGAVGYGTKDIVLGSPLSVFALVGYGTKDIVFGSPTSVFPMEKRKGAVKTGPLACMGASLGATRSGLPRMSGPMGGIGPAEAWSRVMLNVSSRSVR